MLRVCIVVFFIGTALASDVLDYGDSDFESKIKGHGVALVEFFAPWCGHCKRLAPEYETAATELKKTGLPVGLVKVDCVGDGKDVCSKYGVSGYPTLKIFRDGEFSEEYGGPREAAGIVKYMKTKSGPASKSLMSAKELDDLINGNDDVVVVGFFEKAGSDADKEFQKLASAESEKLSFAHTYTDVGKPYKSDQVVLFRSKKFTSKFESAELVFDGSVSMSAVKTWLRSNRHGLAGLRSADNANDFVDPYVTVYYSIDLTKDPKGFGYWRNRVMKVAKAVSGLPFAVSNVNEMNHELGEFGMPDAASKAAPVATARSGGKKFVMTADFSVENLQTFAQDVLDGKLEPYMKSEEVPASQDEAVVTLVAKNFDEVVNAADKDVLIEFYAPWCGHCKSLAPKYEELAEKLKEETGVTIAKMDATANDVPPQYKVQGFPTLFFVRKGSKDSPVAYNGGREVDDFMKYLAKEATDELSGFDRSGKEKKSDL